jgi:hypothetical protein
MHQATALLNACITHSSFENYTALPQFYIMSQIKAKNMQLIYCCIKSAQRG